MNVLFGCSSYVACKRRHLNVLLSIKCILYYIYLSDSFP